MCEMCERLKQIREVKKMSQAKFAKLLGIGQSTLGMMEVGKREILDRHIKTICSICNINEEWLRYGTGEMLRQPNSFSLDEYAKERGLTPLESDIIRGYMSLDSGTRKMLMDHFREVFQNHIEEESGELDIDKEVEDYRRELEQEKSIRTSEASQDTGKDAI